jgi:predicted dinucleotide-binding enzyme
VNVAIVGNGRMGSKLAALLKQAGATVTPVGRGGAVPKDATIVVLAVPYPEVMDALAAAGDLSGRIIADMVNPIGPGLQLATGLTTSAAEEIQREQPRARVVKAFNTVFAELLDRKYGKREKPPQVMICGDDAAAKAEVVKLIELVGLEPYDCGPLVVARFLEPIGGLIVHLAYGQNRGTRIAPRLDQY